MLRCPLVAVLMNCLVTAAAAQSAGGGDLLLELKAAYVYRFTSFIEWPEAEAGSPFRICVAGDPSMQAQLGALESAGRRAQGRPIVVRGYRDTEAARCQVLFIGAAARDRLASIVREAAGAPVLLVGDTPGLAGRGVAIELFRKPDVFGKTERLRFRIDARALRGRGLTVSAQLFDVAEVIE